MLLALLARQLDALTTGGEKDENGERLAAGAPASRLSAVLERVSTWHRRRSLVVLITDTSHPDARTDPAVVDWLRRLSAQHELIAIQVADDVALAPGRGRRRDIELAGEVPAFLREDKALAARLGAQEEARRSRVASLLDSRRIEHVTVTSDAVMVDQIAELLARQRLVLSRRRR